MAKYKSKPEEISMPINLLYEKLSDMRNFGTRINELPEDIKEKIGDVRFENDRFVISTPQVGEIAFAVVGGEAPNKIIYGTPDSPLPLEMAVNLKALNDATTEVYTSIEVEIPMMLRPMVGPKLQEAADKFGEMISNMAKA